MHKTILVDKSDVLADDDDENINCNNNKFRGPLMDNFESKNDSFCGADDNKRIENEVLKLEQKMNELQSGMKTMDDKLEQIFQLLKSK